MYGYSTTNEAYAKLNKTINNQYARIPVNNKLMDNEKIEKAKHQLAFFEKVLFNSKNQSIDKFKALYLIQKARFYLNEPIGIISALKFQFVVWRFSRLMNKVNAKQ